MGCGSSSGVPTIKMDEGGDWPEIKVQLLGKSGTVVDLTNAASITFHAKRDHTGVEITGTCDIVGAPTNGTVQYAWQAGDTDVPGMYVFWFVIVWAGGATGRIPKCVGDRAFLLEICEAP